MVPGLVPCRGVAGDHSAAAKDAQPGPQAVGHGRGGDPRDGRAGGCADVSSIAGRCG